MHRPAYNRLWCTFPIHSSLFLCFPGCDITPEGPKQVHLAAKYGNVSMLKYIVEERGCSASALDEAGVTPLFTAVKFGRLDAVRYLVNEQGCSPTYRGEGKCTSPLCLAAFEGHLDILQFFVKKLDHFDPNAKDFCGKTLLHWASMGGQIPVIQYLIRELGADKNALDPRGHTPLSGAAEMNKIEVVLHLLEKEGCEVRDAGSFTPLYYASTKGYLDLVKAIVQSHPHLCVLKDTPSPLFPACHEGQLEVLQYLVEVGGYDPKSVVDEYGNTLVHYAAVQGHINILRHLIDNFSCDLMRPNGSGNTPLHSAASKDNVEVVKFLYERSAEGVFIKNSLGQTALQVAQKCGSHTTALYLKGKMSI